MTYLEFYKSMQDIKLVSANWRNILKLIETEYNVADKDDYLKILVLYFSLMDEGNVYMPLDSSILDIKFKNRIDGLKVLAMENGESIDELHDNIYSEIKTVTAIANKITSFNEIIGTEKLFIVNDNKLYTRKNFNAVESILISAERLFVHTGPADSTFNYKTYVNEGFNLTDGQNKAVCKGINNNLLITGGPGTGKTTSIFFLLFSLLIDNPNYEVYLTAPSGKAASRMKESILHSIEKTQVSTYPEIINKIKGLGEYTIHRLLEYDPFKNHFVHNKNNQFEKNSIFVVDEASMIDAYMFAALLEAIPTGARVFILGDKNQLPSVECGAVFASLLSNSSFGDNIVELDESQRFNKDTEIFRLAEIINIGGDLSYINDRWKNWADYFAKNESKDKKDSAKKDLDDKDAIAKNKNSTPVYYCLDESQSESNMMDSIAKTWYEKFYKANNLYAICSEIESYSIDSFNKIWNICEDARILCACNKGIRGIQHINSKILNDFYSDKQMISGFYPGELLIVTKNNKLLDLYNGDCGVTVRFKDDDTLYLMLKKSSNYILDDKRVENTIFKIEDFLFYPIRFISSEDVLPAFAITIHKSQGSDYNNILVVLPKGKGHPLLNRQIIYTAITRTKNSTYILSNQANLETASKTVLVRDTF